MQNAVGNFAHLMQRIPRNRSLNSGRFVTVSVPLIGIKPDKKDGMFYMMEIPFSHAKDEDDWARSVLQTKDASAAKLYKKLRHGYGRKYVRRLRTVLTKRLLKTSKRRSRHSLVQPDPESDTRYSFKKESDYR